MRSRLEFMLARLLRPLMPDFRGLVLDLEDCDLLADLSYGRDEEAVAGVVAIRRTGRPAPAA